MQSEFQGIVPYIFVDDAEHALSWYAEKFGFEEIGRWANEQGRVGNAEMRVGKTEVCINSSGKLKKDDERPIWIGIWVSDVDVMFDFINGNGISCSPPVTREFGVRMLNVEDGMGHLWGFIKRV